MAKATDIPTAVRREVHERDRSCCRVCGAYTGAPELHHIVYRSHERNHHVASNLVTLCYRHHRAVHTRPQVFRPALEAVVEQPGTTAAQWLRWQGVDLRGLERGTL